MWINGDPDKANEVIQGHMSLGDSYELLGYNQVVKLIVKWRLQVGR